MTPPCTPPSSNIAIPCAPPCAPRRPSSRRGRRNGTRPPPLFKLPRTEEEITNLKNQAQLVQKQSENFMHLIGLQPGDFTFEQQCISAINQLTSTNNP